LEGESRSTKDRYNQAKRIMGEGRGNCNRRMQGERTKLGA
jgi:hypothetical protein